MRISNMSVGCLAFASLCLTLMGSASAASMIHEDAAPADVARPIDCAKAASAAQKKICADPKLVALDKKVAAAFAKARERLAARPEMAAALAEDQNSFEADRDSLIANATKFDAYTDAYVKEMSDPAPFMEERATLLDRVLAEQRQGFKGYWGGAGGLVWVFPDDFGETAVSLSLGRRANDPQIASGWLCDSRANNPAKARGNELRVDAGLGDGCSFNECGVIATFALRGPLLTAAWRAPTKKVGKDASACMKNPSKTPVVLFPVSDPAEKK